MTKAKRKGQSGIAWAAAMRYLLIRIYASHWQWFMEGDKCKDGEKEHSPSLILSDSVNTLLTHINHCVMVNRCCMLPAQIKKLSLSRSAFSLKLWGTHSRYCCIFTRLYISIPISCEPKVENTFKVDRHALIRRHNCLLLCILPPCYYSFLGLLTTFTLCLLFFL